MRKLVAGVTASSLLAMSSAAGAQPQPQPQPAQAAWYRLTLNDGRVVDVQIVGGDATNYHVQMGGAVYSLPRANVVSSIALQPAATAPPPTSYSPPATPIVMAPPAPEPAQPEQGFSRRTAGVVYFGLTYGLTAMIAAARKNSDADARLGFIPVMGPLAWALTNDEDSFAEDGWDWLAVLDSAAQASAVYLILAGGRFAPRGQAVTLTPVSRRNFHGLALGGSF